MTFEEYDRQLRRVHDKREVLKPHAYTMRTIYRWYRKSHKNNMTEKLFDSVIRRVNEKIAEHMFKGEQFKIPHRMGSMELRKVHHKLVRKNGKLSNRIDWKATREMWYEDEDARNRKILIRYEDTISYQIYYNKFQCNCDNIKFYEIHTTRNLKRKIRRGMEEGEITDALDLF